MKQVQTKEKQLWSLKVLQSSSSLQVHRDGLCNFFFLHICFSRCGDRSFGCRGGMLTSGEESSAEWRWAPLDTDEEQRSEEWLVRLKELQMNPPDESSTPLHLKLNPACVIR